MFFHLSRDGPFSESRAKFYLAEAALGIAYLHHYGVIYRDLKPENILIDAQGHIVITDFGLSKKIGDPNVQFPTTKTRCGTAAYQSFEIVRGIPYSYESDWWTLGVLLFEMVVALPPFHAKTARDMQHRILFEEPEYPSTMTLDTKNFISLLLSKDPKKRLGFNGNSSSVLNHSYFISTLNMNAVLRREIVPEWVPTIEDDDNGIPTTNYFHSEFTREVPIDNPAPMVPDPCIQHFTGFPFVEDHTGSLPLVNSA